MQIKTKTVSCHTADSKPVKQEVNGTVILPPLVFPGGMLRTGLRTPSFSPVRGEREREREKERESVGVLNFCSFMLARVHTPSSPVREREREREREGGRCRIWLLNLFHCF